jgi:hypothetical protein
MAAPRRSSLKSVIVFPLICVPSIQTGPANLIEAVGSLGGYASCRVPDHGKDDKGEHSERQCSF